MKYSLHLNFYYFKSIRMTKEFIKRTLQDIKHRYFWLRKFGHK